MNTIPPADLGDPHVLAFCRRINPHVLPVRMPIEPETDCKVGECFSNTRRKVEACGGRIRFGWTIWEWPTVYIEAEHHAIYEAVTGEWIDITPAPDSDTERVFLSDDAAVFDFKSFGIGRDSIRASISAKPIVAELFANAKEIYAIRSSAPLIDGRQTFDAWLGHRLQTLMAKKAQIIDKIGMTHTSRNAACFCGSGKKFKRCHGR